MLFVVILFDQYFPDLKLRTEIIYSQLKALSRDLSVLNFNHTNINTKKISSTSTKIASSSNINNAICHSYLPIIDQKMELYKLLITKVIQSTANLRRNNPIIFLER